MKSTVHRLWKYCAIVLALMLAGLAVDNWQIKKSLDGIYSYEIQVTVVDADTDKPLENIMIKAPSVSSSDLFQQTSGTRGPKNGVVRITGIAYEPREWSFGCDGYGISSITIDENSKHNITVKLQSNKAEQNGVE